MTGIIKESMVGVAAAWSVAGYAIWKWGPGLRRRSVRCPEKRRRATVLAGQREVEFATLQVFDIKACSLLDAVPPDCSKQCRTCF
jgi:hypothetical protein